METTKTLEMCSKKEHGEMVKEKLAKIKDALMDCLIGVKEKCRDGLVGVKKVVKGVKDKFLDSRQLRGEDLQRHEEFLEEVFWHYWC